MSIRNHALRALKMNPAQSLEEYTAALTAMSPEELANEKAAFRMFLSPAQWNSMSSTQQADFQAKGDVLRSFG